MEEKLDRIEEAIWDIKSAIKNLEKIDKESVEQLKDILAGLEEEKEKLEEKLDKIANEELVEMNRQYMNSVL